ARQVREQLASILALSSLVEKSPAESEEIAAETRAEIRLRPLRTVLGAATAIAEGLESDDPAVLGMLLGWLFLHPLGQIMDAENAAAITAVWMDEWMLGKVFAAALQEAGLAADEAQRAATTVKMLLNYRAWLAAAETETGDSAYELLRAILQEQSLQAYLGVNRFEGVIWFNKEALEQLLWWMLTLTTVEALSEPDSTPAAAAEKIARVYNLTRRVLEAEAASGYQVPKLLEAAHALD
ncbi:MAG TPA: hypothetical protein PLQ85_14080, partial [Anaerolineae bacterium]|nr:hypothetical protein [Anaerolineae bacterium]